MEVQKSYSFKSNMSYKKTVGTSLIAFLALMFILFYLGSRFIDLKNLKLWGKNIVDIKSELQKSVKDIMTTPIPSRKDTNLDIDVSDTAKSNTNIYITGVMTTPIIEKTQNGIKYKIQNKNTTIEVETNTQINKN